VIANVVVALLQETGTLSDNDDPNWRYVVELEIVSESDDGMKVVVTLTLIASLNYRFVADADDQQNETWIAGADRYSWTGGGGLVNVVQPWMHVDD